MVVVLLKLVGKAICWMNGVAVSVVLRFLNERSGATAIEYGLIAGGIAGACIAAMMLMGNSIEGVINTLGDMMTDVQNRAPGS